MSYVSIYIPAMKLDRIKLYCSEHKTSLSKLFSMGAMAIVNRGKISKCKFCSREAMGKFEVSYYDEAAGMLSEEVFLCEFHKNENEKRNEVSEI